MSAQPHWQPWTCLQPPPLPSVTSARSTSLEAVNWHPALQRLVSRLPAGVAATLSTEQLRALSAATQPAPSHHRIEYRVSVGLFRRRYYLTVFAGRDRRTLERLRREGQISTRAMSIAATVAVCLIAGCGTLLLLMAGYVLKSSLGIDLFEGPSVLHDLLF